MSLQQKAIVFDIDGVLAEFTLAFKSFINIFFPYRITPTGAMQNWNYTGISKDELAKVWEQVDLGKWNWENLPSLITEGDKFAIEELNRTGVVCFEYVTNRRGPKAFTQSQAWLSRQGLPDGRISVVDDKAKFITEHVPNVFAIIEDSPANIQSYVAAGFRDQLYVRDWPYNRNVFNENSVDDLFTKRVSSVAEFCYEAIRGITNRYTETGLRVGEVTDPVGTPKLPDDC